VSEIGCATEAGDGIEPVLLKKEVEAQVARYPGRVTFARIPRERNGVADELAKDGARASKALSADRRR
jgi:hypothetical protein